MSGRTAFGDLALKIPVTIPQLVRIHRLHHPSEIMTTLKMRRRLFSMRKRAVAEGRLVMNGESDFMFRDCGHWKVSIERLRQFWKGYLERGATVEELTQALEDCQEKLDAAIEAAEAERKRRIEVEVEKRELAKRLSVIGARVRRVETILEGAEIVSSDIAPAPSGGTLVPDPFSA